MRTYSCFVRLLFFCLLVTNSFAQDSNEELKSTLNQLKELGSIQVYVDNKLITDWSGVRKYIKLKDFSVGFDSTTSKTYSNLTISAAKITLIRNNKRIAIAFWTQGGTEPLNNFYTVVRSGDRYEMQFTFITQRKNGEQVSFKDKLIYNLPLL